RTFPIHADLRPVLKALPRHADGFVFRGPDGKQLTDKRVREGLKEVQAALAERFPTPEHERGFAHGTPHSFRHYFCSTCANGGVAERMVMNWLGHKNSEMVRHYYHVYDEEARRQMGRLSFGEKAAETSE
nr:site-specific integrase [Planctomycetaceae bacterium]